MQLGKWAIWGEITFDPELAQFDIISNDYRASWVSSELVGQSTPETNHLLHSPTLWAQTGGSLSKGTSSIFFSIPGRRSL